jgi:hypothetical protein
VHTAGLPWIPEVGAVCGKAACTDLCGGREVTRAPTATIIDGPATADRFADLIVKAPRSFYNSTSIGTAIEFAASQIARAPFEAERRAIDVSGDGTNNAGRDVQFFDRRRLRREQQRQSVANPQTNGKVQALAKRGPDGASSPASEPCP